MKQNMQQVYVQLHFDTFYQKGLPNKHMEN